MAQPSYQGRFIWTELLSNDPSGAASFYTRILPWKAQPFSPGSPYTVFTASHGKPVAGAVALSDEARALGTAAHWRGYIGAADVDAIVVQATQSGATVRQPAQDVPGIGRVAILSDPEGAVFGVYRPLHDSGGVAAADSGFAWFELAARHRETALAFYQRLFGWQLKAPMDVGGGLHYQTFGLGGQDFGGAYTIPADRPMSPAWCPYAGCSSADEVARKVVAAGGGIAHGPVSVPGGGRIVQFFDPQRVMFAAHSMAPAVATSAKPATKPAARSIIKPAKKAAKKVTRNKAKKKAKKTTRKPAKKQAAKRVVRRAKQKPAKRKARKRARKPARKPARKVARKPARRPARKK